MMLCTASPEQPGQWSLAASKRRMANKQLVQILSVLDGKTMLVCQVQQTYKAQVHRKVLRSSSSTDSWHICYEVLEGNAMLVTRLLDWLHAEPQSLLQCSYVNLHSHSSSGLLCKPNRTPRLTQHALISLAGQECQKTQVAVLSIPDLYSLLSQARLGLGLTSAYK